MSCEIKKDCLPGRETLTEGMCPVRWAYDCVTVARNENCGKNVMCRDGMTQLQAILGDLMAGLAEAEDFDLLRELCRTIATTPGCELAAAAAENVLWSMDTYASDWDGHRRRRCAAMLCFYDVMVKPDACTGCGKCPGICPVGAIAGGAGLISVVNTARCNHCGQCFDACPEGAVVKAGLVKPPLPEAPVPVGSFEAGARRRRRRGSSEE